MKQFDPRAILSLRFFKSLKNWYFNKKPIQAKILTSMQFMANIEVISLKFSSKGADMNWLKSTDSLKTISVISLAILGNGMSRPLLVSRKSHLFTTMFIRSSIHCEKVIDEVGATLKNLDTLGHTGRTVLDNLWQMGHKYSQLLTLKLLLVTLK